MEGDLYRIHNPFEENLFAEMIVAKDKRKAIMTAMKPLNVANGVPIRIYSKGLNEDTRYEVKELNLVLQGKTIMNAGLLVEFPWGDFTTVVYHIYKVETERR